MGDEEADEADDDAGDSIIDVLVDDETLSLLSMRCESSLFVPTLLDECEGADEVIIDTRKQ